VEGSGSTTDRVSAYGISIRPCVSYEFVEGRTHDGRKFRMVSIIDEVSRECLSLPFARRLRREDVLAGLAELFVVGAHTAHVHPEAT
jgi:putative transposase